ncbi:MAG: putative two-component sensor histidine kinase with a histidine kinase (N-term) and an ATP-binding [Phenylobacterium sp.]|nr:putative two-component sensor histidine kinase with a histidine kinase (N-term) and an ATP-binding [Phenylobacterium sp.]MDB5497622.1 putative two-component sensor histidine kinase with a histidine kinase (N-term) and an ATP-binding [Phenylobacterium sp.]
MGISVGGGAQIEEAGMHSPAGWTPVDQAPAPGESRSSAQPTPDERRELEHRLANSLQLAADFLLFEQARLQDPQARAALAEAAARLSAVAQLHRFLSAHPHDAGVDLEPFLTELCGLIGRSAGLSCSVDADSVTVPGADAQQLAIAINELAMNAAKHAYRKGEPGSLHVECHREGAALRLTVSDEGAGLGRDFSAERASGLGMTILKAVVRQLRGSLEARDDHGARFTITLPLSPALPAPTRSFAPRRADLDED